jgi:hypothetical protein
MEDKLSANQRWKKSNTTLPFKEWLSREDEKRASQKESDINFIPFVSPNKEAKINNTVKLGANGTIVDTASTNQTFGISNTYLIIAGVFVVGAITYYYIKKAKAKK